MKWNNTHLCRLQISNQSSGRTTQRKLPYYIWLHTKQLLYITVILFTTKKQAMHEKEKWNLPNTHFVTTWACTHTTSQIIMRHPCINAVHSVGSWIQLSMSGRFSTYAEIFSLPRVINAVSSAKSRQTTFENCIVVICFALFVLYCCHLLHIRLL